jgi:uncharacterized protein (DUF2147 family)
LPSLPRARRSLAAAVLLAAAVAAALAGLPAFAQPADAVTGLWLTEEGDKGGRARVEVKRTDDGTFRGTIVWLEEPLFEPGEPRAGEPKVDLENPDPALRERPVLGLAILEGFTYDGDGTWSGGTIYDPANGKTYKARLRLDDEDTLDVRGYVGIPLFGRTTTWRRAQ